MELLEILGIGAPLTVARLQDGMPASLANTPMSMTNIFFPAQAATFPALFPTSFLASADKSARHSSTTTLRLYVGELQESAHRHLRLKGIFLDELKASTAFHKGRHTTD